MKKQGLQILATLVTGLCLASPSALAGGAGPLPPTAPVAAPKAVPNARKPMSEVPDGCVKDYKTASTYFQAILGEDASIDRIPAFALEVPTKKLGNVLIQNTIKDGGGPIFIEAKISVKLAKTWVSFGPPMHTSVEVCKKDGKLIAKLNTSTAVIKGPLGDTLVKSSLPEVPDEIVIAVIRNEQKEIVFKSETHPDMPAAAVTVR